MLLAAQPRHFHVVDQRGPDARHLVRGHAQAEAGRSIMMPLSAWPWETAVATRMAISSEVQPPRSSKGKPFWCSQERTCSFSSVPALSAAMATFLARGDLGLVVG